MKGLDEVSVLLDENLYPTGEYIKIKKHVANRSVILYSDEEHHDFEVIVDLHELLDVLRDHTSKYFVKRMI